MRAILAATLLATLAPAAATGAPRAAATPAPAKAAPADDARTAEARAHFRRGAQLYKEARYREAIAEFQAAYRVKPSGVLHFNIGQAQEKLGDIPAALASYNAYLREQPSAPNRETVQRAMGNLQARLAATGVQMLYLYTDPPDAEVWVDGQLRGRSPFNAALPHGAHAVSLLKAGYRTVTREVVLSPDRSLEMTVSLQPGAAGAPLVGPPPAGATTGAEGPTAGVRAMGAPGAPGALAPSPSVLPPEATKPVPAPKPVERKSLLAPLIAGGVAVVAAGAGVAMGLQARNAQNELLGSAHDAASAQQLASKAQSSARTANILYGVAGAAALTGGCILAFGGYF